MELTNNGDHPENAWLRLSEAADYLGVHFTTLRRWTDEGEVPCIRTPGGRRRFNKSALDAFLKNSHQEKRTTSIAKTDLPDPSYIIKQVKHHGIQGKKWLHHLDDTQRSRMRSDGRKLTAILMQYTSRREGGEDFLKEGQRLASHYGQVCRQVGFTMLETVQAFISIRRSIIDSLYETDMLIGSPDEQTWQLYHRVDNFLDVVLLAMLETFQNQSQESPDHHSSAG
ncbi:MAG: helix-turn-helix domain-containing protein [Anaerolineales bacterium]|nr:helix-turn-helix domain-containing protein [Anaerolineales bacterium]MBS3753172.1 helix-turn-helix domain-containing protein [Anaerolineales bacterium]